MKVMLITDSYPPEIRSAAQLMKELAEELVERNHAVTVLTTWPQYNIAVNQSLDLIKPSTVENGVKVQRIKTLRHHNVSYIFRGISQILMPFYFKREIRKHPISIPDVVLIYSPPLTLSKVGIFLKKKLKKAKIRSSVKLLGIRIHHLAFFLTPDLVVITFFCQTPVFAKKKT